MLVGVGWCWLVLVGVGGVGGVVGVVGLIGVVGRLSGLIYRYRFIGCVG